jgi:hypothetical protein
MIVIRPALVDAPGDVPRSKGSLSSLYSSFSLVCSSTYFQV